MLQKTEITIMKFSCKQEYLRIILFSFTILCMVSCKKCKSDDPKPSVSTSTGSELSQNTLSASDESGEYLVFSFGRKTDFTPIVPVYQELVSCAYYKNDSPTIINNTLLINDSTLYKESFFDFYFKNIFFSNWLSKRDKFSVKVGDSGNLPKMDFEIKNIIPDTFHVTSALVLDTTQDFEITLSKQFTDANEVNYSLTSTSNGIQEIDKVFTKGNTTNKAVFTVADLRKKFIGSTNVQLFVSIDKVLSAMVNGKKVFVHQNSEINYEIPIK